MNGCELNGRQLRVDFAENEKKGEIGGDRPSDGRVVTDPRLSDRGHPNPAIPFSSHPSASSVPIPFRTPGTQPSYISPMESKPPTEVVKGVVESLSQAQIHAILSLMKEMAEKNPDQAQQILRNNPQLAFALLHAQSIYGLVTQDKLKELVLLHPPASFSKFQANQTPDPRNKIPLRPPMPSIPNPNPRYPPSLPPSDPRGDHFRPPVHDPRPPPGGDPRLADPRVADPRMAGRVGGGEYAPFPPNFGPPAGPPIGFPPPASLGGPPPPLRRGGAPLPVDPEHQELIQRVLRLTPDQIQQLPPQQRQQIIELQKMYG